MNTEKYQTIEEKILNIYSGKAEKLVQENPEAPDCRNAGKRAGHCCNC